MSTPGLIVIGSGPAGLSAAATFREHNSDAPITILTDDPALPYQRPPLSKEFLRGDAEAGDARLQEAAWFTDRGIDIVIGEVTAIDTHARQVSAGDEVHPYRWLVIAAGARPTPPAMPGAERALLLRSLAQAQRLRDAAQEAKSAVVIGSGFIGCEAAASLAMRGITTTLVAHHDVPQAKRLGSEAGERIAAMIGDAGARYLGGSGVAEILDGAVRLDTGETIECDLVLAATGVTPQAALAEAAGIETGYGRVLVDSAMRTSAENVFAAGDVAWAHNDAAGRRVAVEHWQDADDQGVVAGANAAGQTQRWSAVPGFWTTIGEETLKYHSWGDGYDRALLRNHDDGFTVWYVADGAVVGVLTHNADDDYDRAEPLISAKKPLPADVAA
ncbi:NAD(P)/FAD-dependent oxidoreductase [Mycobacterium sp. WMMD1722]|uniref:NAD(P)/FAD-dependent oxidoreductase n=1 Tax=Mycobacterium sp. WMMD1722 TaxID=3404117 RepID=UPI003BF55C42